MCVMTSCHSDRITFWKRMQMSVGTRKSLQSSKAPMSLLGVAGELRCTLGFNHGPAASAQFECNVGDGSALGCFLFFFVGRQRLATLGLAAALLERNLHLFEVGNLSCRISDMLSSSLPARCCLRRGGRELRVAVGTARCATAELRPRQLSHCSRAAWHCHMLLFTSSSVLPDEHADGS